MLSLIKKILIYSLISASASAVPLSLHTDKSSIAPNKLHGLIQHAQYGAKIGFTLGASLGLIDILKPLWLGPLQARQHIYMHNNMLLWHTALSWVPLLLGDQIGLTVATGPGSGLMRLFGNVKPGILGPQSLTSKNLLHSSFYMASLAIDTAILGGLVGGVCWGGTQTIKKIQKYWTLKKKNHRKF
ncbi:MAG: hypothetical protein AB8C84_04640 [Oligoflexales bacterium]